MVYVQPIGSIVYFIFTVFHVLSRRKSVRVVDPFVFTDICSSVPLYVSPPLDLTTDRTMTLSKKVEKPQGALHQEGPVRFRISPLPLSTNQSNDLLSVCM